jgi:hypothetical protein
MDLQHQRASACCLIRTPTGTGQSTATLQCVVVGSPSLRVSACPAGSGFVVRLEEPMGTCLVTVQHLLSSVVSPPASLHSTYVAEESPSAEP